MIYSALSYYGELSDDQMTETSTVSFGADGAAVFQDCRRV